MKVPCQGQVQQHGNNGHHGEGGLELAPDAGGDDHALLSSQQPQTGYHKFPCNDDDQRNGGHPELVQLHQHRQRRNDQHLVRQRIQKLAEVRHQPSGTGDLAVQHVRKGCHGKDDQRQQEVRRNGVHINADQKNRDENDTQQCQLIRQIHRLPPPPAGHSPWCRILPP